MTPERAYKRVYTAWAIYNGATALKKPGVVEFHQLTDADVKQAASYAKGNPGRMSIVREVQKERRTMQTESYSHLHRLVEVREDAMNQDMMTEARKLAGMRPVLPSLTEALLSEWPDAAKMSNDDLRKAYQIGKEREDSLMGRPLRFYKAVCAEMKKRGLKESTDKLGNPEVIPDMKFGTRYKYNHGIFIDHVVDKDEFHVSQAGRPSKKLGFAKSLAKAKEIALRKGDFMESLEDLIKASYAENDMREALGVPELNKWKITQTGGKTFYTIKLHGKTVTVSEVGEPPRSGLYRYRIFIDGKRYQRPDETSEKGVMRTVEKAMMGESDLGEGFGAAFGREAPVSFVFSTKEKAMAFKKGIPSSVRGKASVRKTKGWKTYSVIFQPFSFADRVEVSKLYKPEEPYYKDIKESRMSPEDAVNDLVEEQTQKMAGLTFQVIDMQGQHGFPEGAEGLVYHLKVEYKLKDKYTGDKKTWKRQYVIRTDHRGQGWRVDEVSPPMPPEAIPGVDGHYKSPMVAAKKLAAHLKSIRDQGTFHESNLGESKAGSLSMWDGQDWFYKMSLSDGDLYFRPTQKLKNGNLKGLQVDLLHGRRGAPKAALKSVDKMDFRSWQPISPEEMKAAVIKRFRDRLDESFLRSEGGLDEAGPDGPFGSFKSPKAAKDFYEKVAKFYHASAPEEDRRMPGATRWNVELPASYRAKKGVLADLKKEAESRGGHLLGVQEEGLDEWGSTVGTDPTSVAAKIMKLLGGGKEVRSAAKHKDGISFHFKGRGPANHATIVAKGGKYTMTFKRDVKGDREVVKVYKNLESSDLKAVFKKYTGVNLGESYDGPVADGSALITEDIRRYRVLAGMDPLPRRLMTEALQKATVRAFLAVLSSKITQYDKRVSAKERMPNIYRLGHLLGASQRVEERVKKVIDQDTPEALKALMVAMDREFTPDFSPVKAVKKQIGRYLETGKMPTLK